MTISIENFVKTIYKQSMLTNADTKISTIAGLLNISNAGTTDMARKLATKNLINYTKYKPLKLTDSGKKLALNVIRKHRLWESFLHKTLDLSLHEIHKEAEQLEHLTSDFLADKIEEYLGSPTFDPHGDPIPANNGDIESDTTQLLLSEAEAGNKYKISRLSSSDKEFFDFCTANHIKMGADVWIERRYESNKMTEVSINQNKMLLNDAFASVIFVKQTV